MRGPRVVAVAQKKPDAEMLKKRKAETKPTKEKSLKKKKDFDAPKRPSSAFFVFMEDFRKSFKENCPDNKSVSAVGKAGGEKWKSMSDSDKAPYIKKAEKKKAEYVAALEVYNKKLNGNGVDVSEDSGKSTSEINDEAEQEVSS